MRTTKPFDENTAKKEREIIVYGAGVYGEIAYYALRSIGKKPDCFCDQNRGGENVFQGIPVICPNELHLHQEASVILATYNYFDEMLKQCKKQGCENVYDMEQLLQMPIEKNRLSGRALGRLEDLEGYRRMLAESMEEQHIRMNHIDFVVCENCTLRCRDCANLISAYERPEILNKEDYYLAMDRLMERMDYVGSIYLLGGEPFLNTNLQHIIDKFSHYENSGGMTIFSNGTIVPDRDTLLTMKKCNVAVHISDYHIKSQKIREVSEELEKTGVRYVIKEYKTWIGLGDFRDRHRTKEQDARVHQDCFFRKQYTFHRGRLFYCPRSAHGTYLKMMKESVEGQLDFTDENQIPTKEELREFIADQNPPYYCHFCDGGNIYSRPIPAAIQKEG